MAINNSNLRFQPLYTSIWEDQRSKDNHTVSGNKHIYTYDCGFRKEDPSKIVKWLRKNFGERGYGWDFYLNQQSVIIEIWDTKFVTMYEMWIV